MISVSPAIRAVAHRHPHARVALCILSPLFIPMPDHRLREPHPHSTFAALWPTLGFLYPWQGPEDIGRYPWHMPGIQQPRIFADIPGICHGYLQISRGRYPNPNPNRKKLKMHLATEQNY